MPIYEFQRDSDGEIVEVVLTIAEFDRRVKDGRIVLDDGETATYSWDQHKLTSTVPSCYPQVSSAAGVNPSQIKQHMDHLRAMGCGTVEHTRDGDVVFADKAQRKQVCEALGLFDPRASYGDPQPKHRTKNCKSFIR